MSPRTGKQNSEIRKYKEKLILTTALELFSKYGYLGVSMQKISKEVGVSKGNLYNYFESKEELLEAVLTNGLLQFSELLASYPKELVSENDFEKAIRGNILVYLHNHKPILYLKEYLHLF